MKTTILSGGDSGRTFSGLGPESRGRVPRAGRGRLLRGGLSLLCITSLLVPLARAGTKGSVGAGSGVPPGALDAKWDPARLKFPPLGLLPEVAADRFVLPNGLVVYLVQDLDFPDLEGNLMIGAGTVYDPPSKVGLGGLTGQVLRTGGSLNVPGDTLDARLEEIGASIETSVGETSGSASFYCLKEYGDQILTLLADLLRHPAFPQEKLDLAKMMARRRIASRNDEPGGVATRVLRKVVWGPESPYAREVEYANLAAISTEDMQEFHKRYFVPNHMILAISGDFDPKVLRERLTALFGDWPRSDVPLPPAPPLPTLDAMNKLYLAERPQMTQSYVYVAEVGIKADNPDFPAMEVLGEVLGGGFSSRIFNLIRTQRGLAYASGCASGVGYAHPGIFDGYALTRSDSTLVTLALLRGELKKITQAAPSEEEVRRARESLLNSFVFNFRSKSQVVSRQAYYEFYGYPSDFLTTYQERLRKVTPEEVLRVARAYLHPDQARIVVVGDPSSFAQPLSSLGPVETVDLTIPADPVAGEGRGR
jgi:zinc protease